MNSKIIRYREYILRNAISDMRHRYAGTTLGLTWLLLNPLVQITVYALVFTGLMGARLPSHEEVPLAFSIYLCAGLLPWIGFSEIVNQLTSTMQQHSNDLKTTSLPEQVLFARNALPGCITMLIPIPVLLVLLPVSGIGIGPSLLALPLVLVLLALFSLGIGIITGIINTLVRDFRQIINTLILVSLWATPIIYVENILPDSFRSYLPYNPLYSYIDSLQNIVLFNTLPVTSAWISMIFTTVLALLASMMLLDWLRSPLRDCL